MARYFGKIGYIETQETRQSIWEPGYVERKYYGDVIRHTRKLDSDGSIVDGPVLNNSLSIVADPYAYENFMAIRYAEIGGVLWKVTNVEIQRPRLILTIGGLWNGQKART